MQKRLLSAVATCLFLAACLRPLPAIGQVPFSSGDRVLFLGDSITQDGKYVALVEAYLWAAYPKLNLDIVNAGLGSETVSGITEPIHPYPRPNVHDRLGRALDKVKPDWVIACYGMNDGIYHPTEPRIFDAYRDGLKKLIDEVASRNAKLILMTPPSFDVDAAPVKAKLREVNADEPYGYKKPYAKYNETLNDLADVVKSLKKNKSVERVIDLHAATDQYLRDAKSLNPEYQYGDGVHPPVDGHLAIANAVLAGLGCDPTETKDVLTKLTGIQTPTAVSSSPSADQKAFFKTLTGRFSARSLAYRSEIGSSLPTKQAAMPVAEADRVAAESAIAIRSNIASLLIDHSVKDPYVEAAVKKWNDEIIKLEKLNDSVESADDAILFIGSSSIRLWENIASDMAPYKTIQRGYGGAKFSDLVVFAERLIKPHRYQALVIFVGNDVTGKPEDRTPQEVEELAKYVCEVSLAHRPDAPVFIIEITPTPSRFAAWKKISEANSRLRELTLVKPGTHFIATADSYLDENKLPKAELFRDDRLHQNDAGYALWKSIIKRKLDSVLTTGEHK